MAAFKLADVDLEITEGTCPPSPPVAPLWVSDLFQTVKSVSESCPEQRISTNKLFVEAQGIIISRNHGNHNCILTMDGPKQKPRCCFLKSFNIKFKM